MSFIAEIPTGRRHGGHVKLKPQTELLVIEYDHDTRVSYRKILEDDGYVVLSTANGKSGMEILQRDAEFIRLVILSLSMPIMDGNEFLRLKSADAALKSIPVVVITDLPNSLNFPATEIVQKPINKADLMNIVKKYLLPS